MTYGPSGPQPDPYGQQPSGYGAPDPQNPYGGAPGYGAADAQNPYGSAPGYGAPGSGMQPYGGHPGGVSQDERTWALLGYLGQLLIGFVSPLILLLARKESPFLQHHAKQGLNFVITQFVYMIINMILIFLIIGIFTMLAQSIAMIVFLILAGVAGNRGEWYRFPTFMAWPMIK